MHKDLFKKHSKQITEVVKYYVIRWQSRAKIVLLQLMCQSLAARAGCRTQWCHLLVPFLPPPPPCHTAAVQQGLPGTERHMTFLPSFCMLLCPSYLQLSPPSTSKTWPMPVVGLILSICCSFQIYSKIKWQPPLLIHKKSHLKIHLHSPFPTNGKSKCQAKSNLACGLTLLQKHHHNT